MKMEGRLMNLCIELSLESLHIKKIINNPKKYKKKKEIELLQSSGKSELD